MYAFTDVTFLLTTAYSDLLTRQLSAVDRTDEVYEQCIAYTQLHATMLSEVGLDFKDQLAPKRDLNDADGEDRLG